MTLATNRKIGDYEIIKKYEAGLILRGAEIKSVTSGEVDISGAYVLVGAEAFLYDAYIKPIKTIFSESVPKRSIKLLLNKNEIRQLANEQIIPLDFHIKNGKVKVTIASVRRLKKYDKRDKLKKKAENYE